MSRRWKWIAGGAGVLVVALVGGPFVFIHFIQGPPPKPLSLTVTSDSAAPASGAPAAAAGSVDGTYTVGTGSQAGYRVKETLFGQSTTAVGRTSSITGTMTVAGTTVPSATFTVDMNSVASDQSQRDNQFKGRIMDVADYPTATFVSTAPVTLSSIPAVGQKISATATGKLTLHGTSKAVTLTLQATRSATGIQIAGEIPVHFADYGIDNPSGGPATTGDDGTVEVLLDLVKS